MKKLNYSIIALSAAIFLNSCASLYLKSGKEAYTDLKYQEAIKYLDKGLVKKEDENGRRMLAESYLRVNDYPNAVTQFEKANLYTGTTDIDRMNYARSLMGVGRYAEARTILEGIISRDAANQQAQNLLTSCKKADDLRADSLMFTVALVNLPAENPVFSALPYEGGLVVTSSPALKGDKDPYTSKAFTDLYFTKQEGSSWTSLQPLTAVNSKSHDAVAAVSPNGQTMILTRSFQIKNNLSGNSKEENPTQLYISKKSPDGNWSKPEILPFCDVNNMYAHPSFSPDGTVLYFASDMPGGKGGMDLYKSTLMDGAWGNPVNLGGDINTKGDELFPSIKDAGTLYFSSNGHSTLGGLDILRTNLINGTWSIPQHLSYPINTSYDDFSMVFNPDGKTGYLSSDRSGSDKVYSFEMNDAQIKLEGIVTGKDSMLPLGGARITVQNLTDGTEKVYFSDGDGKFSIDLEPGKDYKIKTDLDGYFSQTEDVSTKGINQSKTLKKIVEMPEVYVTDKNGNNSNSNGSNGSGNNGSNNGNNGQKKGVYPVPNIYWDYNKWEIRPDAQPYLDDLVKLFRNNQNLKFEIRSHCDCRGSFEYNDDLSSKRAKAVTDYLITKGVPRSIIVSRGYGERELLNECSDGVYCDESKHQENRRTEFIVTDKK